MKTGSVGTEAVAAAVDRSRCGSRWKAGLPGPTTRPIPRSSTPSALFERPLCSSSDSSSPCSPFNFHWSCTPASRSPGLRTCHWVLSRALLLRSNWSARGTLSKGCLAGHETEPCAHNNPARSGSQCAGSKRLKPLGTGTVLILGNQVVKIWRHRTTVSRSDFFSNAQDWLTTSASSMQFGYPKRSTITSSSSSGRTTCAPVGNITEGVVFDADKAS